MYFESSQPFTFFTVHAIGQVPFCSLFNTIHQYTVHSTSYQLYPMLIFFPCTHAIAQWPDSPIFTVHPTNLIKSSFFTPCTHAQWPDSPIFTLHPNNFIKSSFFFRCTHAQWRDSPIFYCYYIYLPRGTQRLILTSDVLPFAAK